MTKIKHIRLKGNILLKKSIIIWASSFILILSLLGFLCYFVLFELLFQLLLASPFQIYISLLFLSTLAATLISQAFFNTLFGKQIELYIKDDKYFIVKNRNSEKKTSIQSMKSLILVYNNNRLNRIRIATDKSFNINIGGVIKGINTPDLNNFIEDLKDTLCSSDHKFLHKQNKQNTIVFTHPQQNDKGLGVIKQLGILFTIVFSFIGLLIGGIYFFLVDHNESNSWVSSLGTQYNGSLYYKYEEEIYFKDIKKGYRELENVDVESFQPLTVKGENKSNMSVDVNSVFTGGQIIEEIQRQEVNYIGADYVKDSSTVFYKANRILHANPSSFEYIKYFYSHDKNRVFYKQFELEGADYKSFETFPETEQYAKDRKYVYYKEKRLEDVNASDFIARRVDYKLIYGSDGEQHFINGIPFTSKVKNRLLGTSSVDLTSLQLLTEKHPATSAHMLFYDKNNLYYFDEKEQLFMQAMHFKRPLHFRQLDKGLFTDEEYIYFTRNSDLRFGGRFGASYVGDMTSIHRVQGIDVASFKKLGKVKCSNRYMDKNQAVVWTDGKNNYIQVDMHEFSFVKLKELPLDCQDISIDVVEPIENTQVIVKIKTRF